MPRHLPVALKAHEYMAYHSDAGGEPMSSFEDVKRAFAGRYLLESEIGQGGSARVFAAQDLKHDRRVAIKVLRTEVAQSIAADRFLREIRVDAALQHPRILPLFDSGEVLGSPYFVMPFVGGATLRARLGRDGPLALADALRITTQLADALQYAHGLGLVHRDVKPENVLLQDDHVWLADFGIARALQDANTGNVTVTGTVVGTPAYMSPEQRMGLPTLDGKSDQYSLACVLYEMLTGHPPKLFERAGGAPTPAGRRVTPARNARREIPQAVDEAMARALQLDPDDRWPSMQAFAGQLLGLGILTPPANFAFKPLGWSRGRLAIAAVAVVSALATMWLVTAPPPPVLDPLTVAVLPLAHDGDAVGEVLDGDDCSRFLRDAIGRWTGIRHVDDMQLRDVRVRMGRPETFGAAMTMAKRLGAGLAVWGTVSPSQPALHGPVRPIRLFLYDVATGSVKQEANGVIDATGDLSEAFQILADALLTGTAEKPTIRVAGSRNFGAVRAYLDGHGALDTFKLAEAAGFFRRAVELDPAYGLAFLWLAWSTMWTPGSDSRDWGAAASRALAVGSGLSARDSVHARALVSMDAKRFVEACDLLRSLVNSDRGDFAAWYGLGECLSRDYTVIPSTASPSGWQFRTSISEAIGAYKQAVELVPSFNDAMGQRALQRISRWLFTQTGRYRPGLSADSTRFVAWPSLAGDTLAFVPFSERAAFAESAGTRHVSYQQALQKNRSELLAIVNRWVELDSTDAIALETLALARESSDELLSLRKADVGLALTGLAALRRARTHGGRTGEPSVRLAATEVRFLIKTERYAEAKRLADSLLNAVAMDSASAGTASWMQSLAMLTGRVDLAIAWGRRSTAFQYRDILRPDASVSPAFSAAASDAATFAALGAPPDSVRAALARAERALVGQIDPSPEVARQLYVEQPLLWAWPSLGPAVPPASRASAGNRWLNIQLALARGDSTRARSDMWQADSSAVRGGVSEVAFEIALLNSRIWLVLGDTASAMRAVSTAVDLVRTSGDQLIQRPTATASFVRALVQRASLAELRGDTAQARLWGSRAWLLWRDADPMLAPVLSPIVRWRGAPMKGGVK